MKLIPIREYPWDDDYSYLRTLTCKNHPTAKYFTKNPFNRSIHPIALPEGDIPRSATGECLCPFDDLAVVVSSKVNTSNVIDKIVATQGDGRARRVEENNNEA